MTEGKVEEREGGVKGNERKRRLKRGKIGRREGEEKVIKRTWRGREGGVSEDRRNGIESGENERECWGRGRRVRRRKEGKVGGREVKKKRKVEDNMTINLICVKFLL